jgi:beta-lactamase class D
MDEGEDIGWWVGYIEQNEDVYFFATRLRKSNEISNSNFGECRKSITLTILRQLNMLD